MKSMYSLTLLTFALPIYAADKVHAIDLVDAEYAARCAAIHITMTLGQPNDAPEVGNNLFRAALFSGHRLVTDDVVKNHMPWSVELRKNDSGSFVIWMSFCDDLEMAAVSLYREYFQSD